MLETVFTIATIYFGSAVALGVGSSTIVIFSFFVALADGKMDPSERRMLGVIYWTLRGSMLSIAFTAGLLTLLDADFFGSFAPYLWMLIFVLYLNAALMTKHWISPKVGPAIQAGTWYTLGFLFTAFALDLFELTPFNFITLYAGDLLVMLFLVNGYFWWQNRKKSTS